MGDMTQFIEYYDEHGLLVRADEIRDDHRVQAVPREAVWLRVKVVNNG